jgi:hypothetical protein
MQTAAEKGWTPYAVGLCACDANGANENDQGRWKKFFPTQTRLIVTYDRPPHQPLANEQSKTTDCYKQCKSPAVVRTTQPRLSVGVSDPFGGDLKTNFEVRASAADNATLVATNDNAVVSGSPAGADWQVPAGKLTSGRTYYWRAHTTDENDLTGDWSAWQTITIDTSPPSTPAVSSSQYPFKSWGQVVGTPGTFEFSSADTTEYTWWVDSSSTTVTTSSSASYTPAVDMPHVLGVYATDVAGNKSSTFSHQFWVTPLPNRCWNWRLNEASGTTAVDHGNTDASDPICGPMEASKQASVLAQPAALSGSVSFGPGKFGNAASFTGAGQIATAGPVLDTSKSFTVMAWVRPTDLSGDEQVVISQDGTTTSRFTLMYRKQANNGAGGWCFALRNSDSVDAAQTMACATGAMGDSRLPAADGTWVHLGGVYYAETGTLQLHVMGNQDSCSGEMVSAPAGAAWSASGSFVLGRGKANGAPTSPWRGDIDQVYAHQRALSAVDICQQASQ